MKSIVFFNNKGGVGKTTLLANTASRFADRGLKVLVIDADPQCNSTQLILPDALSSSIYDGEAGRRATVYDVVRPLQYGEPIDTSVDLISPEENRFGVSLLPGHPTLSRVEDRLSAAWIAGLGGDIGGLRLSSWVRELVDLFGDRYDYAFLDVGPSLGSLNRSVLVGADYFVAPMTCDIFSILGLRNIGSWLDEWLVDYENAFANARRRDPEAVARFNIRERLPVSQGFVGYTVAQYSTKTVRGEREAVQAFDVFLQQFSGEATNALGKYAVNPERMEIGDVPQMGALVPMAQTAHAPLGKLVYADGIQGGHKAIQEKHAAQLDELALSVLEHVGDTSRDATPPVAEANVET